jgi:hypothetical protein
LEGSFILSSHTNSQMFRGFLISRKLTSEKIQQPHRHPRPANIMFAGYGTPPITDCDEPHNDENETPQQF